MSLELVELVMSVEDRFNFRIPEQHYERLKTVGDMHQFILEHLRSRDRLFAGATSCVSIPLFLKTRQSLTALTAQAPLAIRPATPLSDVIPLSGRGAIWNGLEKELAFSLPSLTRRTLPRELLSFCVILAVVLVPVVAVSLCMAPGLGAALGALLTICVVGAGLLLFTAVDQFPRDCQTVGDIVRWLRIPCIDDRRPPHTIDSDQVWDELVTIVSEQLQIPPNGIQKSSRWIEDLGCD